jgi:hypothetical protein
MHITFAALGREMRGGFSLFFLLSLGTFTYNFYFYFYFVLSWQLYTTEQKYELKSAQLRADD